MNQNPERRKKIAFLRAVAAGKVSLDHLPVAALSPEIWDEYDSLTAWERDSGIKIPKLELRSYLDRTPTKRPRILLYYSFPGNTRSAKEIHQNFDEKEQSLQRPSGEIRTDPKIFSITRAERSKNSY